MALFIASLIISCSSQPPPPVIPGGPAAVGKQAPNFTLQTLDGQILTLSDFRGKVVVLNFWGILCPGCVEEMPYFQAVSEKWTVDKVVVLAVHVHGSTAAVKKTVDNLGLTFPILHDADGAVCNVYGRGYPTTFFIDSSGIVRVIEDKLFESPDQIESVIADLVARSLCE